MSVPRSPSSPQVHSATVLLKVRIGDAEIKGVKEVQGKKNPPNYFCSVHVLDRNYNPVGYIYYHAIRCSLIFQDSGTYVPIWPGDVNSERLESKLCAQPVCTLAPILFLSQRYAVSWVANPPLILVFVSAVKEGKEAKILATTHIQLDDVPTTGKLEKRFPFLDSKEKENGY